MSKLSPEQKRLNECLNKANRAIDLAVKELTKAHDGNTFKETDRQQRVGNIRPVDLVISRHFTSETLELYVVVDLKGTSGRCYVRYEAWCRLYYLPDNQQWSVHYVDIIVRHKTPAARALFMFEHTKSGEPSRTREETPDALCLFFETPQGGMWG